MPHSKIKFSQVFFKGLLVFLCRVRKLFFNYVQYAKPSLSGLPPLDTVILTWNDINNGCDCDHQFRSSYYPWIQRCMFQIMLHLKFTVFKANILSQVTLQNTWVNTSRLHLLTYSPFTRYLVYKSRCCQIFNCLYALMCPEQHSCNPGTGILKVVLF